MRLAWHFIIFHNEFNKFNNTEAQMLDSIYHMMFKFFVIMFDEKTSRFCPIDVVMVVISFHYPKICKSLVVYRF